MPILGIFSPFTFRKQLEHNFFGGWGGGLGGYSCQGNAKYMYSVFGEQIYQRCILNMSKSAVIFGILFVTFLQGKMLYTVRHKLSTASIVSLKIERKLSGHECFLFSFIRIDKNSK